MQVCAWARTLPLCNVSANAPCTSANAPGTSAGVGVPSAGVQLTGVQLTTNVLWNVLSNVLCMVSGSKVILGRDRGKGCLILSDLGLTYLDFGLNVCAAVAASKK